MMRGYVLKRLAFMLVTIVAISVVSFAIIQLPPGDYLSAYVAQLSASGVQVDQETLIALRIRYGLDQPIYMQYLRWVTGFFRGDMGQSFVWNMPVTKLIATRLPLTIVVSIVALVFAYVLAIPIGIYSAIRQYSFGDYLFTALGFVGLATPNFLLALVLMFVSYSYFGLDVGGLFSEQYVEAAWSGGKVIDMIKHLPVPVLVVGMASTASIIRTMRACLLDELRKQYVITARAKGLAEHRLLFKYPVRIALNPIISSLGWILPGIVSGETITAIVLGLPTIGPLLFNALLSQDMYLAGGIVMLLSIFVIAGTFLSDILLAVLDPRIRLER
jgi:peptide/nickel transport system permease protein